MRRVVITKATWQADKRTVTVYGPDGTPFARLHMPLADERALMTAAYALNFAIKGPHNAKTNVPHNARGTEGTETTDLGDNEGRSGTVPDDARDVGVA